MITAQDVKDTTEEYRYVSKTIWQEFIDYCFGLLPGGPVPAPVLLKVGEINFTDLNAGPYAGLTTFVNGKPAGKYLQSGFIKTLTSFTNTSGETIVGMSSGISAITPNFNTAGTAQALSDDFSSPCGNILAQDVLVQVNFSAPNAKLWTAGKLGIYISLSDFPPLT